MLLEAAERVGGTFETLHHEGWCCEQGPNTLLESDPAVASLLRDTGLATERLAADPTARRRYLWLDGGLVAVPGHPLGLLRSSVLSRAAKFRLLREPWAPTPPDIGEPDESVADFVRRRLGSEILERVVEPFLSGIYAGDPERLAVRWALPKVFRLERDQGSLVKGLMAARSGGAGSRHPISFAGGLEALTERLAERLGDAVRRRHRVLTIERRASGFRVRGEADGCAFAIAAEHVLLALPASPTADLLEPIPGADAAALREIPHSSVAVISFGFARRHVDHALDGFGFLAPRNGDLRILGCLFPSSVFPHRAPTGHVALSCFIGGRTDPAAVELSDSELLERSAADLDRVLGIGAAPAFSRVRRWRPGIPQYELGHQRFLQVADGVERDVPNLHLLGNWRSGVSIADCIRTAAERAEGIRAGAD